MARAICEFDISKATGPGNIPAIRMKMCSLDLSLFFVIIFNKCLLQACLSACWKFCSIIPAYKNDGERSDPRNYRQINPLPKISKVSQTLINDKLVNHLENCSLFSDIRYGFMVSR